MNETHFSQQRLLDSLAAQQETESGLFLDEVTSRLRRIAIVIPQHATRHVVQAMRSLCLFVSHFLVRKHDPEPHMVNDLLPQAAFAQTKGVLSQLPVPGEVLAKFTSRGNEGRMAREQVVPARGIHRDQSYMAVETSGEVLQRSRHGRAVDQGRQERHPMNQTLLQDVQG